MDEVIPNPNGANQYNSDPRQLLCWELYANPKSESFGNAFQSAIKAGYEEATAGQITTYDWFLDKRRRLNMLSKAEKVLDKTLEQEKDMKLAQDTAKFIASRLGKKYYSERTELTGADGTALPTPIYNGKSSDE